MIPPPSWLDPSASYLVGISGGRDSIFLHHWLQESGFRNLTYCHLNHQLRGSESDGDEQFLRDLLGDQLLAGREDVSALASDQKLSIETAARQARHSFFESCSKKSGIGEVLLAHHADDQAETILFNLLRGSSKPQGMIPRKQVGPITFLRPMLEIRRAQIDSYLSERKLRFREDSTNSQPIAVRNRLRNEALPLLAEILARDPIPSLLRSHNHSIEFEDFLSKQLAEHRLEDPQGRLHLPTLRDLHPVLQRRSIYEYLFRHTVPELSSQVIERSMTLLEPDGPPSINLPGGQRLRRRQSRLFISS